MPDDLYRVPQILNGTRLLLLFIVATFFFHCVFIYVGPLARIGFRPLGKRGWKLVDYIWLGAASLALIGTIAQARMNYAKELHSSLETLVAPWPDSAQIYVNPEYYDGIICRTFVRSPLSPPPEEFNKTVAEYDLACSWMHLVTDHLQKIGRWDRIDTSQLPAAPRSSEQTILRFEAEISDAFRRHNTLVDKRKALEAAQSRSDLEELIAVLSPICAMLALALRITKVTGELRLG
jgi:hypothetical protein